MMKPGQDKLTLMTALACALALACLLMCVTPAHADGDYEKQIGEWMEAAAKWDWGQSRDAVEKVEKAVEKLTRDGADAHDRAKLESLLADLAKDDDATFAARQFACHQLAIIGTEESVDELRAALKEAKVADSARYALEAIPSDEALEALRDGLGWHEGDVQAGIIGSLGRRRDAEAVRDLTKLVDSKAFTGNSGAAVRALGEIATDDAVDELVDFVDEAENPSARSALLAALVNAADHQLKAGHREKAAQVYATLLDLEEPSTFIRTAALKGKLATMEKGQLGLLSLLVGSPDAQQRSAAHAFLREYATEPLLIEVAAKSDVMPVETRVIVLNVLAGKNIKGAADVARRWLDDESDEIRVASLQALAMVGSEADVSELLTKLSDGDRDVRDAAFRALTSLGNDAVTQMLRKTLGQEEYANVHRQLLAILVARDDQKLCDILPGMIENGTTDERLRNDAIEALGEVGGMKELQFLLKRLVATESDRGEQSHVEQAIRRLLPGLHKQQGLGELLVTTLKGAEGRAKAVLLDLMPLAGDKAALEAVTQELALDDAGRRREAVRILSRWPNDLAVNALINIIRDDQDLGNHVVAMRGYMRLASVRSLRSAAETMKMYKTASQLVRRDQEKHLIVAGLREEDNLEALKMLENYWDEGSTRFPAGYAIIEVAKKVDWKHKDETVRILRRVADESNNDHQTRLARQLADRLEQGLGG